MSPYRRREYERGYRDCRRRRLRSRAPGRILPDRLHGRAGGGRSGEVTLARAAAKCPPCSSIAIAISTIRAWSRTSRRCSRAPAPPACRRMLNISTRASEWDEVIGLAERESDVMASVGIHPHEADLHPDVETETLVEQAPRIREVIGIGESGLDYYYDHSRPRPAAAELPRPHRRGARDAAAVDRPHPRRRGRHLRDPRRGDGEGALIRR